ncbi:glycerol uptake facilitator-like aquaporin [Asanoa ferruginea]|uniref:Glycerol uptake facilitator-like aquaporin n=1 Tax=Asanoa ferruginea TaxID=53367 RepID=A0A3D9ZQD3_9ACTN|nr:MIP/aquaporin family protein [Asanoa ferruginea]REF99578.1 glycerol uptake facilitator-like aquaporin [Asanoa ferruginea]GIF52284.1 MIP family protein [Asanoa ferruginea]
MSATLGRRLFAEYLGSALLVTAVVGSGIMAARLSPGDAGLQLSENAFATMLALAVLILVLGPVSGAHLNPVVTAVDWWLRRRAGAAPAPTLVAGYVVAQVAGAVSGAVLANVMFDLPAVSWSTTDRAASHLWIGETVATAGLILLVFALVRTANTRDAPAAVGAYIGAAYWFTSSTSFANPAVTIGRGFTDTFAGIAPASVPAFIGAQLVGGALGALLVVVLYPQPRGSEEADRRVLTATTTERADR